MIEQPDLRPKPKGKDYLLWEDWTANWEEDGKLCRLTTYAGFVTDIASVPSACAVLGYKPDGAHRAAAVAHDRLYQNRGMMTKDVQGLYTEYDRIVKGWVIRDRVFNRAECDRVFLELMLDYGQTTTHAQTMYHAVRTFGGLAW